MTFSVAMTKTLFAELSAHLTRADGDEDVCIATYTWSTGKGRRTALLSKAALPQEGDRLVHGNASFNGGYVLRAATEAARRGEGIVLLHSHPGAMSWQGLSGPDRDTESEYQRVAQAVTGLPLVGMTLGTGAAAWSARLWPTAAAPEYAEAVRVVGDTMATTWFDVARPVPTATRYQKRTVAAWGAKRQADIARLRVLVVGVGSVGLDIAARLAATGIEHLGVMDVDVVEDLNLDRMVGATRDDAAQRRRKTEVAARIATAASTANRFTVDVHNISITDPAGLEVALDYDVIFSCVDRPWPRSVLNGLAYSDLIPVIDGGIALETLPNGEMRGGTWRAHAIVPGRRACSATGSYVSMNSHSTAKGVWATLSTSATPVSPCRPAALTLPLLHPLSAPPNSPNSSAWSPPPPAWASQPHFVIGSHHITSNTSKRPAAPTAPTRMDSLAATAALFLPVARQ